MNQKDVNGATFMSRRLTNLDETNRILDPTAGLLAQTVLHGLNLATHTASTEARDLARFFQRSFDEDTSPYCRPSADYDSGEFCSCAASRQTGLNFGKDGTSEQPDTAFGDGRWTGFASNRARNAAIVMAQFPHVDIFTPSMVDLYEGEENTIEKPYALTGFYTNLNLATRGRFLPLVSFSPERQVSEKPRRYLGEESNIDLVRRVIEEEGFIGVKLHPSSGFNPSRNERFGCPNQVWQLGGSRPGRDDGEELNDAMEALFDCCEELQVPILTHGSDSLFANTACMHFGDEPEKWTNSPWQWAQALESRRDLKLCLAHFASRFHDQLKAQGRGRRLGELEYRDGELHVETNPDGTLRPSTWLAAALREMSKPGNQFYLDLSFMPHLVLDQLFLEAANGGQAVIDRSDWLNRKLGEFKERDNQYSYKGDYARGFTAFMDDKQEDLRARVLYGTDWHMPGISVLGQGDLYQRMIENVIPAGARGDYKQRVMGLNAVEFFGLQEGGANRERLRRFYDRHGLDDGDIPWMARIDRLYV